ncbi:hypothetical protein D9613_008924 [Agrocybe pediades]|uniref:BTB domain-containing protein n=1 Tax=Agrocybe pediades TaxID=84607 RepID=A0A8H4QU23_9AGAR|nr:hypothetical protein D9613_008924 [Agrocybe pediades]
MFKFCPSSTPYYIMMDTASASSPSTGQLAAPANTSSTVTSDRLHANSDYPARNLNFNDPDPDVTFRSVDGQLFHLQRKYLEANTGAFPGREFDTRGETTDLTESADILDLLFQFVYPKRDPDIDNLNFETLLGLAEAAEKYEVFHAMTITRMQLKSFVSAHPMQIISHATRHDYPTLIEELIPHLARRSVVEVAQELPNRYIIPWLRYRSACDAIFEAAMEDALALPIAPPYSGTKSVGYFGRSKKAEICSHCLLLVIRAIRELSALESVEELKKALSAKRTRVMGCLSSACRYVEVVSKTCYDIKSKVDEMPKTCTLPTT